MRQEELVRRKVQAVGDQKVQCRLLVIAHQELALEIDIWQFEVGCLVSRSV